LTNQPAGQSGKRLAIVPRLVDSPIVAADVFIEDLHTDQASCTMTRIVTTLAIAAVLTLAGATFAQPIEMPSVLIPGAGAPPSSPAVGQMHLPQQEQAESTDYADEGWMFGPVRPRIQGTWGGVESLLWWNKGRYITALATTSNAADRGVIGAASTTTLLGQGNIGGNLDIGGRVTAGVWLNPTLTTGLGFRFVAMESDRTTFNFASDGSTVLARPFFNAQLGVEDALLIGQPGLANGTLQVRSQNDFLTGEAFGRFVMSGDYLSRVDLIAGYQFARIDDSLEIASTTNLPAAPATFNVLDQFGTQNEFHGMVLGLMGERRNGRAKISWLAKSSIGNMRQQVAINGSGDISGAPLNGGLFAQQSNIGTYTRNRVAFMPEVNLNLHYQVTNRLDVFAGYTFLYISSVALAGDQIDRHVNLSQQTGVLVGANRPLETFQVTDFWLQGINFGFNLSF
jgi:hypothetical protein